MDESQGHCDERNVRDDGMEQAELERKKRIQEIRRITATRLQETSDEVNRRAERKRREQEMREKSWRQRQQQESDAQRSLEDQRMREEEEEEEESELEQLEVVYRSTVPQLQGQCA